MPNVTNTSSMITHTILICMSVKLVIPNIVYYVSKAKTRQRIRWNADAEDNEKDY